MNKLSTFKKSLEHPVTDVNLSQILKSLWYDGKGDWHKAHEQVDKLTDKNSAWVHAYLHRKEGDIWNADYWYKKAGKSRPSISLEAEWETLVEFFITNQKVTK